MQRALALTCPECDARFDPAEGPDGCPHHDDRRPTLSLQYDYDHLRERFRPSDGSPASLWAYRTLLPVSDGTDPVSLGEGGTPLVPATALGSDLDLDLSLKLESANPTGSTKDRGSTILATEARERSAPALACASTGNAAGSTALYAARSGTDCAVFVPTDVPAPKAAQAEVAGADVFAVEGTYADAAAVCRRVVEDRNWMARSGRPAPLVDAGTRTLGYELLDGTPGVPDWIVVPVGNGGTIAALWQGVRDYDRLGLIDCRPRLLGVQAAPTSPIHDAFDSRSADGRGCGGSDGQIEDPDAEASGSPAGSIAVTRPRHREAALSALAESDGASVAVGEAAIRGAIGRLGEAEGVFAEPASAAGLAGLREARDRGIVDPGERVVAVITGDGLKDPTPGNDSTEDRIPIPADADASDVVRARE